VIEVDEIVYFLILYGVLLLVIVIAYWLVYNLYKEVNNLKSRVESLRLRATILEEKFENYMASKDREIRTIVFNRVFESEKGGQNES